MRRAYILRVMGRGGGNPGGGGRRRERESGGGSCCGVGVGVSCLVKAGRMFVELGEISSGICLCACSY